MLTIGRQAGFGVRGFAAPGFLPSADGKVPTLHADFAKGLYYYNGRIYLSWAAFAAAVSATFTRSSTGYYFNSSGVLTSASSDALRFDYDPVTLLPKGILLEGARTNVVLWNRDLTNGAWTPSNITAAKDQTGPDGVANSASSLTATAGNGTILQAITLASSARYQSAYVKRINGTGTINMTMDNGSTWTAISATSSWQPLVIPTQTLANPTVGFQIVTSGDAIAVDLVQNENGTFRSSPIATTSGSVTRAADSFLATTSAWLSSAYGTWFAKLALLPGATGTLVVLATNNAGTFGTGNGSLLRVNGTDNYEFGGNGSAASVTVSNSQINGVTFKIGAAYDVATTLQRVVAGNGSSNSNSTLDFTGVNANRLQIGSLNSSLSQPYFGTIAAVGHVPIAGSASAIATLLQGL